MGSTFAGLLIGVAASSFLSGVANVQSVVFFRVRPQPADPWAHKVAVAFLCLLSTFHICVTAHATYFGLVTIPGNGDIVSCFLIPLPWTFQIQILILVLISLVTKPLYLVRIWKLHSPGRARVTLSMGAYLAAEFGLGAYLAIKSFTVGSIYQLLLIHFEGPLLATLSMAALSDLLISFALVQALMKCNPDLQWTNSNAKMLIAYVLNSGVLPGIVSTSALIAYAVSAKDVSNTVFLASEMILMQVHINCFLAMINARRYFHSNVNDVATIVAPGAQSVKFSGALPPCQERGNSTGSKVPKNVSQTINEAGLPLFRAKDAQGASFVPMMTLPKPMEIFIQTRKERDAH